MLPFLCVRFVMRETNRKTAAERGTSTPLLDELLGKEVMDEITGRTGGVAAGPDMDYVTPEGMRFPAGDVESGTPGMAFEKSENGQSIPIDKQLPIENKKINIPMEKFTQYALNSEKDPNKALAFEKALGYNLSNTEKLIADIYNNIDSFEAVRKPDNGYGDRYQIVMQLTGPNGKVANVLTAWLDDKHTGEIRLISAYVID